MANKVAGIDVYTKILMVVVANAHMPESKQERRRFTTMPTELRRLSKRHTSPICSDRAVFVSSILWPKVRPALLGDDRLKCPKEQLVEALTGRSQPMHRQMHALQPERQQLP